MSELFAEKELKEVKLGVDMRLWNDIDRFLYIFYYQPMDTIDDKSRPTVLGWVTEHANHKKKELEHDQ